MAGKTLIEFWGIATYGRPELDKTGHKNIVSKILHKM
jgi:hypothetical protein